ncbi:Uncharacterised protein [Lysinibacillus sphaericus]|uniref:Uncharacterized protein n=1 Tax=Lysinibacillus sphaericus TaxID=1421 RepID=A0AAJ4ZXR6_LYSSH|nr:hypothetical protein LSP03_25350 [Lysinibacillus sphaericus]SUV18624.1 Uncharacterised protein [Lysinibacillus sphaericus]
MSTPRMENILITLVIAIIIQMFADEISYFAVFVKANITDYLMLLGISIIIGLLIYKRK